MTTSEGAGRLGARFGPVLSAVQANCLLSDARYAQEDTLCNYLLAMREYYRWEHELPLDREPERQEVLRWIGEREAAWEALPETAGWSELPMAGGAAGPFDVDRVNAELVPEGLVYGAGVGRHGKPHFFLAELAARDVRGGVVILEAGCEFARDIEAAPALLQGETVYLRRDAFHRALWLRSEAWQGRDNAGPMAAALAAYGYAQDRTGALERMAERERETLILHELGEHAAGRRWGEAWEHMMARLDNRRAEIAARAVRDLLADCLVTLPTLLDAGADASLHFWFANFTGLRRMLFPRLLAARERWLAGEPGPLREAALAGCGHWEQVGRRLAGEGTPTALRVADAEPAFRLA